MRHLLVCPEFPPAPHSGGIGIYALQLANLLADSGEFVHIIGKDWRGQANSREVMHDGRLVVHRISGVASETSRILERSAYPAQAFSWEAALYMEELLRKEHFDLIESQEYEAPLFYFQLRSALRVPVDRCPPCVIHLHSPTDLIARYNDWDRHHFDWRFASRLERFSMAAADGLLSPSHHLARYAEDELGLPRETVRVIPYPMGEGKLLVRESNTWQNGSVLFVGRFEKRKGILEWIRVAIDAAHKNSDLIFEFVGAGKLEKTVRKMIPASLTPQFHFHGERNRIDLEKFLKRARIAVVPSRWENFPNTCLEAMASGLPVLATSNGGLAEMVVDGKTGWLAENQGTAGLYEALSRALTVTPQRLAEMGREAHKHIRRISNNENVLKEHLDFRSQILRKDPGLLEELFFEMFDEFALKEMNREIRPETFIEHQSMGRGSQTAELLRKMKQKLRLPIPSSVSQTVYKFLAGL